MEKQQKLGTIKGKGERTLFIVFFVIFVVYAITLLYPVLWLFLSSLKGKLEYEMSSPFALPEHWEFGNYIECFQTLNVRETGYIGMVWNSLWMTGLSIGLGIFTSSAVAYVVAKLKFPGRKLIYGIVVLQMLLPTYGSMAASLVLQKTLGIYDTPIQVIVSSFAVGGAKFLILYSFFRGISWEYAEAAKIDGASNLMIFLKIMFPQAIAPIMTFALGDFVAGWNDYMTALIYMPSYPTLATGLYKYESAMTRAVDMPVYFCGVLLSAIPAVMIFLAFRDTFMSSLSMGGLKG